MDVEALNLIGLKCPTPRMINVPYIDKYGDFNLKGGCMYVPCGKCYVCLAARRMQWQFRLECESIFWQDSLFVTLTMDDEHYHDLRKSDLQNLFKSLRANSFDFKYYAIGEYGTHTHRAHYHAIIFTDEGFSRMADYISKYWKNGFVSFGNVTPSSIGYVLHYHVRPKVVNGKSTFFLCSKGLGLDWFDLKKQKYIEQKSDFFIHNIFGSVNILPRYYRKKFLSDKEIDRSKKKHEQPSAVRSFEYWLSLVDAFDAKLHKFNNQDKL